MFVDASALVSVALGEADNAHHAAAMERSGGCAVTPFVLMEAGLAIMRVKQRGPDAVYASLDAILQQFRVRTVELTSPMILTALQASERYGKGRGHPAKLNMGDCLSYAAARTLGVPLLYKGEDFAKTDITSALER